MVNGVQVEIKYCTICKIWRPPRAYHCYNCKHCISRHDHCCPWMGGCIGRFNYPFFYLFLLLTSLNCLVVCVTSLLYLLQANQAIVLPVLICVFTGLLVWPVGGLLIYHTYLISRNVTTHEDMRASYPTMGNPFSKPTILSNFYDVLLGPFFASH